MKTVNLIFAVLMVSQVSQAKVSDFNSLINENIKSQNALHKEVNDTMKLVKADLKNAPKEKIVIVESQSYNAPSRKMQFKKETKYFQASDKKNMDRMATEVKEMNQEF